LQLIESLERLSNMGLTIAMVIHQPRMETLDLIDQIILLQRGGFPVYVGKTKDALGYMEKQLGEILPEKTSPADFFLDVIAKDKMDYAHGSLGDTWKQYQETVLNCDDVDVEDAAKLLYQKSYENRVIPSRERPSHLSQVFTIWKRAVAQQLNNKMILFIDGLLLVFSGGLAGTVARDDKSLGSQICMMINGMMGVVAALKVFGGEQAVYLREMNAGISATGYFLGKIISHMPIIAASPLFFISTYYR